MENAVFQTFVSFFPPVSLPVTLSDDTHHTFDTENNVLPPSAIAQFILPAEGEESKPGSFAEYIPCFSLEDTGAFTALVWWRADLLDYTYYLATFDKEGQLVHCRPIAFTRVSEDRIHRAVATIDEEWVIYIASGSTPTAENTLFDPTTSQIREMEIMPNGEIVG
jgi:hypothetical protein